MKVALFSYKTYDRRFLDAANRGDAHDITWYEPPLTANTVPLAAGHEAVCVFVNDVVDRAVLQGLADLGVRAVVLRCAGFNNVDLQAAADLGVAVVRVPAYSPEAVAEHTVALMLTLNRRTHRAFNRVREGNFRLSGLLGFTMAERTAGIVGTGKIGEAVARILCGFGMRVLACDPIESEACAALGVDYVGLDDLLRRSDIVTLHCPLTRETHNLIDARAIAAMRRGSMLINTSRGAVVDTRAVIDALKREHLGYVGLDVYEQEGDLFFRDLSETIIQDDVFQRLLTFPNVIVTGHQGFFTEEALTAIAECTVHNFDQVQAGGPLDNRVTTEHIA